MAPSLVARVLLVKVENYFNTSDERQARKQRLIKDADVLAYYVTQHCARKHVVIRTTDCLGYSVYAQYKKMANTYSRGLFAAPPRRTPHFADTLPLPIHHFLYWVISRDVDVAFWSQYPVITAAMQSHRKTTSRGYRARQERKRKRGTDLAPLQPTASMCAKLAPMCVLLLPATERISSYTSNSEKARSWSSA